MLVNDEPTTEELNALQGETNLISDNVVNWSDVAECDRERALEWLRQRRAVLRWSENDGWKFRKGPQGEQLRHKDGVVQYLTLLSEWRVWPP